MESVRYFVFQRQNIWFVTLDGAEMARHPSRDEALQRAIVMADLMAAMHHESDVMIEGEDGLTLAWSSETFTPASAEAPAAAYARSAARSIGTGAQRSSSPRSRVESETLRIEKYSPIYVTRQPRTTCSI